MSARAIHWESWELDTETSRRFHRICARVGIGLLAIAVLVQMLEFKTRERPVTIVDKSLYAELLPDAPQAKQQNKPAAVTSSQKPVEKTAAAPSRSAREIAQQSGLLQLRDQLAAMHESNARALSGQQTLVSISSDAKTFSSPGDLAAGAAAHSAGAAITGTGVTGSASGTSLGSRRTGAVQSPPGGALGPAQNATGDRLAASRTLQEIQLIFDRNKSAFDAIFTRAARESAGMDAGKVSVSLTIAPDGTVTHCEIVSSSFGNHEFEQKILQRVKALNFGTKNVPPFTFQNYSLNFLLS